VNPPKSWEFVLQSPWTQPPAMMEVSRAAAGRSRCWKLFALVRSWRCRRMLAQGNTRTAGSHSRCWTASINHASPAGTEGDPQSFEKSLTDDTRCQSVSPSWTEGNPRSPGNSSCRYHGRSRCWKTLVLLGDTGAAGERLCRWETLALLGNEDSRRVGKDGVAGS
jgi:hypothetical protein